MITEEIKLHPEPPPANYGAKVTYVYGDKKWSAEDIEDAIRWAKLCGLEPGIELMDMDAPYKQMLVVGFNSNHETVGTYKGRPAVIIVKSSTASSVYEGHFTVDELLDKRYQYVNPIGGC